MTVAAVLNNERLWHVQTCDVLDGLRSLPDGCVQCVVTSPPYWGLRDYGVEGQIGLEETPDAYIAKMVEVFGEVRRVLRDDGTCWLNIGDSYASGWSCNRVNKVGNGAPAMRERVNRLFGDLKEKDLIGIPWMLAFALRADGWYLRSEIIWHKPNPMPESVTDRPSKAHEQVFLLTKSSRYFYDGEAVKEDAIVNGSEWPGSWGRAKLASPTDNRTGNFTGDCSQASGRNRRSVWSIPINGFKDAHFATFPIALPETCLKAGTSLKGCCSVCGAPWQRVTESERVPTRPGEDTKVRDPAMFAGPMNRTSADGVNHSQYTKTRMVQGNRDPQRHVTQTTTKGWEPGCDCGGELWPCLTLDPFNGAGTTGLVAAKGLGLRYIGFELNPDYADMARRRIEKGFVEPTPKVQSCPGQKSLFGESA